ncbi:polysaccharide deacetylase family protein [Neobacillus drentensis]|uniref:polysaccharide deacetylase family protein n=1 Tax=Neobacillus drentensis TaxID=220684 RepID=UPI003000A315
MKFGKTILLFFILTSAILVSNDITAHASSGGTPILLYHHILKKSENHSPDNPSIINLEAFEEQMKYLKDQGYYTASMSEFDAYMRGTKKLPAKTVVITFDDGHKTNYLYAYPVLKKYGFKATAFLITNRVSDTPVSFDPDALQFLSWPEVRQMKDVFQFGSHTNGLHYSTNGVAALLSESEPVILKDFQTSRSLLNNTEYFAYPFGAYNQRTIAMLQSTGYKLAFTTVFKNAMIGSDPFQIGRKGITPSITISRFKELLADASSKAGWVNTNNKWTFLDDNGVKKTGWLHLVNNWYYLDSKGIMRTGWLKSGNDWYYFDGNGLMKTGWLKQGTAWYYLNTNGTMKTGWLSKGGSWYYLQSNGEMKTGWLWNEGNWYYFDQSGAMKIGWQTVKGKNYYFDKNGTMKTGWLASGGKWHYLDASGVMRTGWAPVKGKWYYFDTTGAMLTGWLELEGKKYYLNQDGAMATGWVESEEKWYYFYNDGHMATNTMIDGYQIGEDGARI